MLSKGMSAEARFGTLGVNWSAVRVRDNMDEGDVM